MEPILTPRLLLRAFVPGDYDALREIDGDPVVLRYRSRAAISREDTRAFLDQAQAEAAGEAPRALYAFAVVLRAPAAGGGRLIGQCGLTVLPPGSEAFLWYALHRGAWGQGYATEAARAVVGYGFESAGLRRIFAECHPANLASLRVMQRIGLRPEAHTLDEDARYPERRDYYRYGLNAEDWPAVQRAPA